MFPLIPRGFQIGMFMLNHVLCSPRRRGLPPSQQQSRSIQQSMPETNAIILIHWKKLVFTAIHTEHSTNQPRTPKQAKMRTTKPRLAQHSLSNGRYFYSMQHILTRF